MMIIFIIFGAAAAIAIVFTTALATVLAAAFASVATAAAFFIYDRNVFKKIGFHRVSNISGFEEKST